MTWSTTAAASPTAASSSSAIPMRRRTVSASTSRATLVRLGHGGGIRRRTRVQSGGRADRSYRAARALRQPLLRRAPPQPPVHGGKPLALFAAREYTRGGGRLRLRQSCIVDHGRNAMDITKRKLIAGAGAAAAAATFTRTALAAWEESTRYPDPRIQILDPSFARYRIAQSSVERLYAGARWSEGPVWLG